MPTVLITGANRGIGLEFASQFASQYAAEGRRVIATCREARHHRRVAAGAIWQL